MKKFNFFVLIFILLISINSVYASEIDINSNNAVLYNLNDNRIIFEKNKDKKVSIASLTKLMTALVAVENIDNLDEYVSFTKSDYDKLIKQDASGSSLKKNNKYTYEDLLYGLLLESGADCANALARLTAGSEKNFVKKMNEKAKVLGMNNSSFSNPIGLDNKNNYSTVQDIAILLKEDLRNPILNHILTTFSYKLTDGTVINHTIYEYMESYKIQIPGMKGGKTGYELKSGYALASIASQNDTTLLLVTSKADNKPDHIIDAKNIYKYYFSNYDYQTIIEKDTPLVSLKAKYLNKDTIDIKANDDIKYYLKNNYNKDDIRTEYEGLNTISLKNKQNEKIGNLKIYYKNELIMNYPIILNQPIHPNILIIIITGFILLSVVIIFEIINFKKIRFDN